MPKLTLHEIYLAGQRIEPYVTRTPLLRSPLLSAQLGCDLWLKLENRQHTGSFKPRGALNKILSLSAEERERGIVAASAGNHALGVAHAAQCLGLTQSRCLRASQRGSREDCEAAAVQHQSASRRSISLMKRKPRPLNSQRRPAQRLSLPTTICTSSPGKARSDWRSCKTCPTSIRSSCRSAAAD